MFKLMPRDRGRGVLGDFVAGGNRSTDQCQERVCRNHLLHERHLRSGRQRERGVHAVDSNTVLIPIAFGEFTGTFTDAAGNESTEIDPPVAKGNAVPANGRVEECSYSFELVFPDTSSFVGSGDVTGFIPGK